MVGVVDASTIKVVGEARVREGRPYFPRLSLASPELYRHPTISDLYNVYKSINVYNIHITINGKN